jgi:hypothetical protein
VGGGQWAVGRSSPLLIFELQVFASVAR